MPSATARTATAQVSIPSPPHLQTKLNGLAKTQEKVQQGEAWIITPVAIARQGVVVHLN